MIRIKLRELAYLRTRRKDVALAHAWLCLRREIYRALTNPDVIWGIVALTLLISAVAFTLGL